MSRCVLDDERRNTEVVIGWDPQMQTFFARAWERSLYDPEAAIGVPDPGVRFWTGGADRTWTSPDELDQLIEAIQPCACSHDKERLRAELLADQRNNDNREYDLYDGSQGWHASPEAGHRPESPLSGASAEFA